VASSGSLPRATRLAQLLVVPQTLTIRIMGMVQVETVVVAMAAVVVAMVSLRPNFAFEADAVKRRAVSCCVRTPRGSTRR